MHEIESTFEKLHTNSNFFRPIGDYAVIGNCRTAALIGRNGSIDWLCLPNFDSPSVFARILDIEKGGFFSVSPSGDFKVEREYINETNILRTKFVSEKGEFLLTDFSPVQTQGNTPPEIVRMAECVSGEVDVDVRIELRLDYGRTSPRLIRITPKHHCTVSDEQRIDILATVDLEIVGSELRKTVRLKKGEKFEIELYSDQFEISQRESASKLLNENIEYWKTWCNTSNYSGPYEEHVKRSALALKLLSFSPTGAIIAAPTTSLPEKLGGVRNWDYRFTWLRDATFMLDALYAAGHSHEAMRFINWLCEYAKACSSDLQIAYGIHGERSAPETTLDHLSGYKNSKPVRVGNEAFNQFQLDTYGELAACLDSCRKHGRNEQTPLWPHLKYLTDQVCKIWKRPDYGIWEVRSGRHNFVHSKVMAWVAIDRTIKAAEELGLRADVDRWKTTCSEIYDAVVSQGWSDKVGAFKQSFETEALDAANLRLSLVGFLPADHPKMKATIERTQERLTKHGLVYRYLDSETDDGLPAGEATFSICTFWLIQNLILLGRITEAESMLDNVLSYASDVGLFAEEIDPIAKEQLGNFPQGFTHVGLINAIVALNRAKQSAAYRKSH